MLQIRVTVRALVVFVILFAGVTGHAASFLSVSGKITPDGNIVMEDGTIIPPFPQTGKWSDLGGKSYDGYTVRQFIYFVPGASPAIELYLATDGSEQTPDGVFEVGLVGGYVKGFASKAGLRYSEPVFEERRIGRVRANRTLVKLSDDRRSVWLYAYVFLGNPSLTFIAIRAKEAEGPSIEEYLAGIELR
jgi:hypothetical protein